MNAMSLMVVLAVLLAGCASSPSYWSKPGGGEGEFDRDKYECERENRYTTPGPSTRIKTAPYQPVITMPGAPVTHVDDYGFASCMRARGWRDTDNDRPTARPTAPVPLTPDCAIRGIGC
jgi:hypothetical protein